LDLKALQTTLREFAAEREWQPFHTPKNLAMALMVEAAELAEIFQWMTPEQSQAARGDLMLQEQVADEVADVLLYLVQLADHTGIDLKRAVGRKLVKNLKKHPPLRRGLPGFRVGTVAAGDIDTHVLIDWENVQPKDDDIRSLVPDVTDIWLFHGPNQKGVAAKHASFGDKATPVKIARTGKNALDFHLSFYMGYIAARHPDARFVVVSNDKGYAPMLEHAVELGFSARQVGFGRSGADVEAASTSSAAKKAATAKKTAAKKATAKKLPTQPAAKKVVVKPPSAPAAKAPAKKVPAANKATAAKKTASAMAAPTAASAASTSGAAAAVHGSSVIDLKKAVSHVIASLRKTTSKPTKHAKLVAAIKSLLGQSADEQAVHSVLSQLLASGKVVIDSKGGVRYALQSA
jgi:NTP pyrophosphatase (non-canonical NTP hydrolase)